MTKKMIFKLAENLVEITIAKKEKGLLNKESMFEFIDDFLLSLKDNLTSNEKITLLINFCGVLAKRGYEIKNTSNNLFDIINYNSIEYELYLEKNLSKHYVDENV